MKDSTQLFAHYRTKETRMRASSEPKQGPPTQAEEKLHGLTQKELDKKIRQSTPCFWGNVDLEPKTLTVTAKVSKTIADLVTSLAAEDLTTKSSEAASLLAEGVWARLERSGTSSPTVQFHLLRLQLGARDKMAHQIRVAWEGVSSLPPKQAAEMEAACRAAAEEWGIAWPPAVEARPPLDEYISQAFRELAEQKLAANEDEGRVRLREVCRKTGRERDAVELAMARDGEVKREEGSHRTVWYSLRSPQGSEGDDRS